MLVARVPDRLLYGGLVGRRMVSEHGFQFNIHSAVHCEFRDCYLELTSDELNDRRVLHSEKLVTKVANLVLATHSL